MSDKQNDALVDATGRQSLNPKHAPVSLPAGSFDIDKLTKGLDKAVEAKPEKREDVIGTALADAAGEGTVLDRTNTSIPAGDVEIEVKNEDLGIVERTTAFSEKAQKEIDKADEKTEQARTGDADPKTTTPATRTTAQSKGE